MLFFFLGGDGLCNGGLANTSKTAEPKYWGGIGILAVDPIVNFIERILPSSFETPSSVAPRLRVVSSLRAGKVA